MRLYSLQLVQAPVQFFERLHRQPAVRFICYANEKGKKKKQFILAYDFLRDNCEHRLTLRFENKTIDTKNFQKFKNNKTKYF